MSEQYPHVVLPIFHLRLNQGLAELRQLELPPELLKKEVANLDSWVASHPASPCSVGSSIECINYIEFAHLGSCWCLVVVCRSCHGFAMLLQYLSVHHCIIYATSTTTVDGINPAPVEVGSLSHYFYKVFYIPGGCLGFLPSTLVSTSAGEVVGGHVGYAVRLDARATRLERSFGWNVHHGGWQSASKFVG